jgi:hypothetical protein
MMTAEDNGIWRQHPVDGDGVARWRRWALDAVAVNNKSINKCKKIKQTHQHVHKLGDCHNVRPDPFAVGLQVDGAGRCADNRAARALLGVHLHKIKRPEQMLQAPLLSLSLLQTTSSQRILTTLMLVPKNLRKSPASFNSGPTRRDARFWMFRAMSAKFFNSLLGVIELIDSSSYTMVKLVL